MMITIELDIDDQEDDDEIDKIVYAYLKELMADGSLAYRKD